MASATRIWRRQPRKLTWREVRVPVSARPCMRDGRTRRNPSLDRPRMHALAARGFGNTDGGRSRTHAGNCASKSATASAPLAYRDSIRPVDFARTRAAAMHASAPQA